MSLISIQNLSNFPNSILICCEVSTQYLRNSFLFTIPYKVSDLQEKVKKINLHQYLSIILYDKGTMYSSSKLFCCLQGAGYTNVKVLFGGLQSCEDKSLLVSNEEPQSVPFTDRLPLSLNEKFLVSKEDFWQMNTSQVNTIYASFLGKQVFEINSKLSKENISNFLVSCGIHLDPSKPNVFYGEVSSLLGLLAHYLDFPRFSVVLDDFDTSLVFKKPNSSSSETIYESLGNTTEKTFASAELEHYVSGSSHRKPKKSGNSSEKDSLSPGPCCGCEVF
jgi:hypothetical protein